MNKKGKKSLISLYLQIILSIVTIILGILSFIHSSYVSWFQLILGIDLIIMAYNNQVFYHRRYFTLFYIIAGLCFLVLSILHFMGV